VSAPRTPVEIIFDQSIPEDQRATLYIMPGIIEVTHFDGTALKPRWFQATIFDKGMDVRIPTGSHSITFNYYGGEYGANFYDVSLDFNAVAGRYYTLSFAIVSYSTSSEKVQFSVVESSQKREPMSDEQLLLVNYDEVIGIDLILDKGSVNERKIRLSYKDTRVIVSRDVEHTIDIELSPAAIIGWGPHLEPAVEPQRTFTASSEPVKYTLRMKISGSTKNSKKMYTLTRK